MASPAYGCGGCTNTWTPLNACHCSGCHQTFAGITGFDKHRKYSKCVSPSTVGLVLNESGLWARPETDTRFAA
jgi:hypothetical protein